MTIKYRFLSLSLKSHSLEQVIGSIIFLFLLLFKDTDN